MPKDDANQGTGNVAGVVGGVVGGVAGLIVIVSALVLKQRKRHKTTDSAAGREFLKAAAEGDENKVKNAFAHIH